MDSWSYIILGVFIVTYLFNLYPKHESQRRMSKSYGNEMSSRSTINNQLNIEFTDAIKETLSSTQNEVSTEK